MNVETFLSITDLGSFPITALWKEPEANPAVTLSITTTINPVEGVLTQISWTNHLMLLSKARSKEECVFYAASAAKEPVYYFVRRRGAFAEAACSNWSAL